MKILEINNPIIEAIKIIRNMINILIIRYSLIISLITIIFHLRSNPHSLLI